MKCTVFAQLVFAIAAAFDGDAHDTRSASGFDVPDAHIVKAIVNLAQGFGCQTIAEGVEDEATVSVLRDFGVDFVQGFHLGRPAPIVERH